jgi:hypothetical protein
MSSGKIGMVLTFKNKTIKPDYQLVKPSLVARSSQPRLSISMPMNHFTNTSMYNIIHTPANGCSSCGR